jgi:hypothetical protein
VLVLQKLSWNEKPLSKWLAMVKEFKLPNKANKSPQVTKLLVASQNEDRVATAATAKILLEAMQK